MKSYQWWRKQKKRVQKKYSLVFGRYLSPKDLKEWYKHRKNSHTIKDWLKIGLKNVLTMVTRGTYCVTSA